MKDYPLIKFVLLFICGITFEHFVNLPSNIIFYSLITFLIFNIVLLLLKHKLFQLTIVIAIILTGAALYSNSVEKISYYPFSKPKIKNVKIEGSISKLELIREKRITFHLEAPLLNIDGKIIKHKSKMLCNIYDDEEEIRELYEKLKVGNSISLDATITRPKGVRNPFEFNYEKYLAERNISILASAYSANKLKIVNVNTAWFSNSVFEIRKYLDNKISLLHNNTTRGMLRGLILADRSGIDYFTNSDFMNAGVVHVLSVSGLHVGYIVLIFLFLFNRFNLYWRAALTIAGLFAYMIITGSEAPVFRSTVMVTIVLLKPFFGRESNSYNTLALAAIIILLLNPLELFNPSFQLSFSAILALIIFFPILKKYIDGFKINHKYVKYFVMFIGSTLIAQIGTLPFTLIYFSKISITSLIANMFVIPISGFVVGIGFLTLLVSTISTWLATIFASCNELLNYFMLYLVRFFGKPDYSFINIRQFSLYDGVMFYLLLGITFSLGKYFLTIKSKIIFVCSIILLALILFKLDNTEMLPENKLAIVSIDVGQGDSFLIKFPNGKTALVDAGNADLNYDNGKRVIIPLLEKLGISKIDYCFISHVDSDHYMGVLSLLKEKKVLQVFKPSLDSTKQNDVLFERILVRNKIQIKNYKEQAIRVGNAKIFFLNNNDSFAEQSSNDNSGVMKLVYGNNSVLFMGDAGVNVERRLLDKYDEFLKSDVLKIGHHGSATSSSSEFLEMVSPKYALINAGVMNKFNHPAKVVLQRLRNLQSNILRTDHFGASILVFDGKTIEPISWRETI